MSTESRHPPDLSRRTRTVACGATRCVSARFWCTPRSGGGRDGWDDCAHSCTPDPAEVCTLLHSARRRSWGHMGPEGRPHRARFRRVASSKVGALWQAGWCAGAAGCGSGSVWRRRRAAAANGPPARQCARLRDTPAGHERPAERRPARGRASPGAETRGYRLLTREEGLRLRRAWPTTGQDRAPGSSRGPEISAGRDADGLAPGWRGAAG